MDAVHTRCAVATRGRGAFVGVGLAARAGISCRTRARKLIDAVGTGSAIHAGVAATFIGIDRASGPGEAGGARTRESIHAVGTSAGTTRLARTLIDVGSAERAGIPCRAHARKAIDGVHTGASIRAGTARTLIGFDRAERARESSRT